MTFPKDLFFRLRLPNSGTFKSISIINKRDKTPLSAIPLKKAPLIL
jgi:hypothetical protein